MAPLVEKYKILVVTMKSATLKKKYEKTKLYAYAYVQPEARLRTKVSHTTWDDKFVFSIPQSSLRKQGNSFVFFKIYKKGWARDSLIGIAKLNMLTLELELLAAGMDSRSNHQKSILLPQTLSDEPRFDEEEEDCFEEDPRYPNMFEEKRKVEEDLRNPNKFQENKKSKGMSTCLEILKGSKNKGVLNVEMELGETIFILGELPWENMAMPYDAFIGKQNKKQNKSLNLVCFRSGTA